MSSRFPDGEFGREMACGFLSHFPITEEGSKEGKYTAPSEDEYVCPYADVNSKNSKLLFKPAYHQSY